MASEFRESPATGQDMHLLAIETTCDETGAAVIVGPRAGGAGVPRVLSSVVASQFDLHARFGGVVPEIAARAHLTRILPVIAEALERADVPLDAIGAVAVAIRPGLVGSLVVGLSAAKALAFARGIPLVAFDHLEGHLYACQLAFPDRPVYPCVGLVVSGGHTHLFHCRGPLEADLLGGTIDDAAGEAFDKVASLLNLGFPGGPVVEQAARLGNPRAYAFPRAFFHDDRIDFSFSGLKTAVLYTLRGSAGRLAPSLSDPQQLADLAASFQQAVVDVLVEKCRRALERTRLERLSIGGGVAANGALRAALTELAVRSNVELFIPPLELCTDNAALGAIAFEKLLRGMVSPLDIDVEPGLRRAPATAGAARHGAGP
jgi:N6-L-threonylcarbamoyladenine synthase